MHGGVTVGKLVNCESFNDKVLYAWIRFVIPAVIALPISLNPFSKR